MLRALFTAAAGMHGMAFMVDNISNNLANANTYGYKRTNVDFQDLLYQTIKPAGTSAYASNKLPTGIQIGHGVRVAGTRRVFTEGALRVTENPSMLPLPVKKVSSRFKCRMVQPVIHGMAHLAWMTPVR